MAVGDRVDQIASRFGLGSSIDRREHAELEAGPLPDRRIWLIIQAVIAGIVECLILQALFGDGHLSLTDVLNLAGVFWLGLVLVVSTDRAWRRIRRRRHQARDTG